MISEPTRITAMTVKIVGYEASTHVFPYTVNDAMIDKIVMTSSNSAATRIVRSRNAWSGLVERGRKNSARFLGIIDSVLAIFSSSIDDANRQIPSRQVM